MCGCALQERRIVEREEQARLRELEAQRKLQEAEEALQKAKVTAHRGLMNACDGVPHVNVRTGVCEPEARITYAIQKDGAYFFLVSLLECMQIACVCVCVCVCVGFFWRQKTHSLHACTCHMMCICMNVCIHERMPAYV
jgi:hypothetical protein